VLVLDAVLEHGMESAEGRTAIRRMNQMHRSYDISNDELRYVLATFVVTPIRWVDQFGWRRMTEVERIAGANYYRALGRHMGIHDIPETWQGFSRLLDAYEREHFGFDPGGRTVAEATLRCSPRSRRTAACREGSCVGSRWPPWTTRCWTPSPSRTRPG